MAMRVRMAGRRTWLAGAKEAPYRLLDAMAPAPRSLPSVGDAPPLPSRAAASAVWRANRTASSFSPSS